ncbi:MAG: DUF4867 family protein [Clostridia bacterium]|nr:DUF4867 family protein [Clostridia bacterium]
MLERLNKVNDIKIYSIFDKEFESFGRVVEDYDFSALAAYLNAKTPMPESGSIYLPSEAGMESMPEFETLQNEVYGGMPIQIGYCNGKNTLYGGLEYHKGSEINVPGTDLCVVLGHVWQIKDNKFYVGDETVFYVPAGTVFEMYQTTLHLTPCMVSDAGFRNIVVLPKGTNTPLEAKPAPAVGEAALLLEKNKWVLSHPENASFMKKGAFPGLIGENKEIKY